MGEWKLFEGEHAHVATFEFHKDRERAAHLEQKDLKHFDVTWSQFIVGKSRNLGGMETF